MKRILIKLAAGVAALVLAAGTGAATYAVIGPAETVVREAAVTNGQNAANTTVGSIEDVAADAKASVVEVTVTSATSGPLGPASGTSEAQGSGFVYDDHGHVVTNAHVVDGAESVQATFANGKTYDATVVGIDASTDLAVLDVDAPSSVLVPLVLGDSSKLAVGDTVVAIGSPFGLENSVTAGIVGALGRSIEAPNGFTINGAIQTDAAINHGSSGGPLLDLSGRVIGVTSQITSESGGNEGVGFAIPASTVDSIVSRLIEDGSVEHAYLGVAATAADGDTTGVEVTGVRSGSPAAEAGIDAGDVITSVGGANVATTEDLQSAIEAKQPGDRLRIRLERDGDARTVTVTLGTRPD